MVIENFKQAYAIARNNRHHRLWAGEMFRFGPVGFVSIAASGTGNLIIGRIDRDNCGPAFYHTVNLRDHSPEYRRYRVRASRERGPVPLP